MGGGRTIDALIAHRRAMAVARRAREAEEASGALIAMKACRIGERQVTASDGQVMGK